MKSAVAGERSKRILNEAVAPYLVDEKRAALEEFLARLKTDHGDDIRRVILFGSHARGEADTESDVDVLVVARGDIENARQVYRWCNRNHTSWVSPLVISEDAYREDQRFQPPFYVNTRRDGIELWKPEEQVNEECNVPLNFSEGEFRMLDYETIMAIRPYLRNTRTSQQLARDIEKLGYVGKAVSELYYAAFYITTGALYLVNVVRGKHEGIASAVSQFLVQPGLLEKEYQDIYNDLMEGRLNVDYRPQKQQKGERILTDDELKQLLRDGERYIERMKQFLIERGVDASDFNQ